MGQLSTVSKKFGQGGTNLSDNTLRDTLNTLLGHTTVVVNPGAGANVKYNVPTLRKGDTLFSVRTVLNAAASSNAPVDDTANCTIQETRAVGTITISGNPVDGDTVVVGRFTYTFKTIPTAFGHVKITAGNNNQMASDLATAINAMETSRQSYTQTATSGQTPGTLTGSQPYVAENTAVASTNTVVVTNVTDGPGNGITTAGTATRLVNAGTGTGAPTWTAASVANLDTFAITDQTGAVITFTVRTAPVVGTYTDVLLASPYTDAAQAVNIANAINAYQFKNGNLGVVASNANAVVTAKPVDPLRGNITPFTKTATNVAVDGAGTLGGTNSGTNTGGIKSPTDTSLSTVTVEFYHKT